MLTQDGMWLVQERYGIRTELCHSFPRARGQLQQAMDPQTHRATPARDLAVFLEEDIPDLARTYRALRRRFDDLRGCGFERNEGFTDILPDHIFLQQLQFEDDNTLLPTIGKEQLQKLENTYLRCVYTNTHHQFYVEFRLNRAHTDLQATLKLNKRPNGLRISIDEKVTQA